MSAEGDADGEGDLLRVALALALAGSPVDALPRPVELREYPLHVIPASQACRKVLYTTKGEWLLLRLMEGVTGLPGDVALLWRYGPLDASQRTAVSALVHAFDAPLFYVGDLDPLDLATYATLIGAAPSGMPALYAGVDGAWLERCREDLAANKGLPLERTCIAMDADEHAGLRQLGQLAVDWPSIVGPPAWALLQSGFKLELEGASSPDLYSSSFQTELRRHLID